MGIYDRDYNRPDSSSGQQYHISMKGPQLPPVVKWLLIINAVVFLVEFIFFNQNTVTPFQQWFAVFPANGFMAIQLWRIVTYQFLHGDFLHIAFNMLMLYFLGPLLERMWGSKQFIKYYLICGAVGGIIYTLFVVTNVMGAKPMVGASGAIYGLLIAIAIMFPEMRVMLYGLIPMKMKWLVTLAVIMSLLGFATGDNAGGEAAHLSGMAAGAVMVLYRPWFEGVQLKRKKGSWAKKMEMERDFEAEVDRILDKVHREGMNSLTSKEKHVLKQATKREQQLHH